MSDPRRRIGRRGELIARERLERMGYRALEANYRATGGEIDLVADKDGMLVFVEVRARTTASAGQPEESITAAKRSHLVAAAQEYLQVHDAEDRDWRIDLVAIEFGPNGVVSRFDVIENAVEL